MHDGWDDEFGKSSRSVCDFIVTDCVCRGGINPVSFNLHIYE
jgi:hypothetical protein